MNLKTVMPLGLAIVLGLVAAFVAKNTLSKRNADPEAAAQVKILVAKRDIGPGKAITAEDVQLSPVPGSAPPPNVFTDFNQVTGRVAGMAGIGLGLPINEAGLASKGTGSGLQSLIPMGMRAVTIDVNETTGLCGMVQPGCMVDVVTTLRQAKGEGSIAKTVVQNVKVTAVGSRVNPNPTPDQAEQGPARSVTLLVTPKDASAIELAASIARPRLVLRGNRDGETIDSAGVTLAELLGDTATGEKDPFAMTGLEERQVTATSANPPGQETVSKPVDQHPDVIRNVTLIRGGVETTVKFRMPRATRGEMTDTPTDLIAQ